MHCLCGASDTKSKSDISSVALSVTRSSACLVPNQPCQGAGIWPHSGRFSPPIVFTVSPPHFLLNSPEERSRLSFLFFPPSFFQREEQKSEMLMTPKGQTVWERKEEEAESGPGRAGNGAQIPRSQLQIQRELSNSPSLSLTKMCFLSLVILYISKIFHFSSRQRFSWRSELKWSRRRTFFSLWKGKVWRDV